MLLGLLQTIIIVAWATSVVTFAGGLYFDARHDIQHMIDIVGGLASASLWFTAAFGAQGLETISGGIIVTSPSTEVAWIFAAFGVIMIAIAFIGTGFLMDVRDVARDGVA